MSEMAVEQKVTQVKGRIEAAQRGQAQARHSFDVADGEARAAAQALMTEFGVRSLEEAQALLARLESERDTALADVESKLAGGAQ